MKSILKTIITALLGVLICEITASIWNSIMVINNVDVINNIEANVYKISFLICVIIAVLHWLLKKYIVNVALLPYIFAAFIVFALYRFDIIEHSEWYFVPIYWHLNYLDVVVISALIVSVKGLVPHKNESKRELSENPSDAVSTREGDKFNYYEDAEQLVERVLESEKLYYHSSLTVGLRGAWGMGKTSYLNMIELIVKDKGEKFKVVKFNPWQSNSYEQMVSDFFTSLSGALCYDATLRKRLKQYTQAIIKANIGWVSKLMTAVDTIQHKSLQGQFNEINSRIRSQEQFIFVLIDDLDRLDKAEMLNLFKLMRVNANFGRIVFVVAYDYNYVKQTLSGEIKDVDMYLEKIFTCPYTLPHINEEQLATVCKMTIANMLMLTERESQSLDKFFEMIKGRITLRNSVRLANQVAYSIGNLKDENGDLVVDLGDYLAIAYIGVYTPEVYSALEVNETNKTILFKTNDKDLLIPNGNMVINQLKKGTRLLRSTKEDSKISKEEYIENRLKPLCGNANCEIIYSILETVFTPHRTIGRASNVHNYGMFFARQKPNNILTRAEFYNAWELGSEHFVESLNRWLSDKEQTFLTQMIANVDFGDSHDSWLRLLKDFLIVYPYDKDGYYILIPGENTISSSEKRDATLYISWMKALKTFLEDIQNDSILFVERKFAMLESQILKNECHFISTTLQRGIMHESPQYKHLHCVEDIDLKALERTFIGKYLEMKSDYSSFNEYFWFRCREYHDSYRVEYAEPFLKHIKYHMNSFIDNYPIKNFDGSILSMLFEETRPRDYSPDRVFYKDNRKQIKLENFINFLESIESPTPKLIKYIEEAKSLTKN